MRIEKVISWNETGKSRSHQAGILVPKAIGRLLMPDHKSSGKNPKKTLRLSPFGVGVEIEAVLTYYNSKTFGGTRDEFRITRLTDFMNSASLMPGDKVIIEIDEQSLEGTIDFVRESEGDQ